MGKRGFIPNDYVNVNDRITKFRKEFPISHEDVTKVGSLLAEVVPQESGSAIVKAKVLVGGTEVASDYAFCQNTSEDKALEKAVTVAKGRALASAGYEIQSGIASAEEIADYEEKKSYKKPVEAKKKPLTKAPKLPNIKKEVKAEEKVEESVSSDTKSDLARLKALYNK